jgi:hypothetical protein
MTRRGIIGALIGAATMDPERLLWGPGAKVISIPKSVKVVTLSQLIMMEQLKALESMLLVQRKSYVDIFNRASITGDTINVQKPARVRG